MKLKFSNNRNNFSEQSVVNYFAFCAISQEKQVPKKKKVALRGTVHVCNTMFKTDIIIIFWAHIKSMLTPGLENLKKNAFYLNLLIPL